MCRKLEILSVLGCFVLTAACGAKPSTFQRSAKVGTTSETSKVAAEPSAPTAIAPQVVVKAEPKPTPPVVRELTPVPEKSIVKGSFTFFTIPNDPVPDEPYTIIVKVAYPQASTNYNQLDLTVQVKGSDGYLFDYLDGQAFDRVLLVGDDVPFAGTFLDVDPATGKRYSKKEKSFTYSAAEAGAEFSFVVLGGNGMVKDTISVNSKLLKEFQTAIIEF